MILDNAPKKAEEEEKAHAEPAPSPAVASIAPLTLEEKKVQIKGNLQAFLKNHTIYDVLPMNGQVLVFNTELPLFEAITALADHNIFCGVLWDESKGEFLDLFTIRDIMEILVYVAEQIDTIFPDKGHTLPEDDKFVYEFIRQMELNANKKKTQPMEVDDWEKPKAPKSREGEGPIGGYNIVFSILKKIRLVDWATLSKNLTSFKPNLLVKQNLKNSLFDACEEMATKKIHRLAIIEEDKKSSQETLCGIITHDMIMSYIIANLQGVPAVFEVPIKELSIGTYSLLSISQDCTLFQVLHTMKKKRISFLPIVTELPSEKGAYATVGYFSLKDLITLIRRKKYHMMRSTMKDILRFVQDEGEGTEVAAHEAMENTEEELSASVRMMSISGELPSEVMEEIKHDQLAEKIYGIDRLFTYSSDETLKAIIEKIVASPDKRLVNLKKSSRETISVIAMTDIFLYVTS